MTPVAIFDINETTLDLAPVRRTIDQLLGHGNGFTIWFQKLLQLSMTTTATGNYADFTMLAKASLHAVAESSAHSLPADAWDQVGAAMGSLAAYPDVQSGLTTLRSAGWTTVALTNSAPASVEAQLAHARLTPLFDYILSVDAVQAYKPARDPYLHAAERVGADPEALWMVACHDWDLAGARAVGMSTAFVRRPNMAYAPNYRAADITTADFNDLADQLVARS